MSKATTQPTTVDELATQTTVNKRFYADPYLLHDCVITAVYDAADNCPQHVSVSSDSWAFTATEPTSPEGTDWYVVVDPQRSILYAFWEEESGSFGGHHQLYPKAFHFF